MPNSNETSWATWIIGDPVEQNEFHLVIEDAREGETRGDEIARVKEILMIHVELMNSLNLTGGIHVCRVCAGLN